MKWQKVFCRLCDICIVMSSSSTCRGVLLLLCSFLILHEDHRSASGSFQFKSGHWIDHNWTVLIRHFSSHTSRIFQLMQQSLVRTTRAWVGVWGKNYCLCSLCSSWRHDPTTNGLSTLRKAIYVRVERPFLKRGLRYHKSPTYKAVDFKERGTFTTILQLEFLPDESCWQTEASLQDILTTAILHSKRIIYSIQLFDILNKSSKESYHYFCLNFFSEEAYSKHV